MIATFVRNTCSPGCYRLELRPLRRQRRALAMIIISYNNICKGPLKPGCHEGDDVDEETSVGAAAGRQCDACVRAGKDRRTETVALGAGVASAAEGAGRLGRGGRKGIRRHDS